MSSSSCVAHHHEESKGFQQRVSLHPVSSSCRRAALPPQRLNSPGPSLNCLLRGRLPLPATLAIACFRRPAVQFHCGGEQGQVMCGWDGRRAQSLQAHTHTHERARFDFSAEPTERLLRPSSTRPLAPQTHCTTLLHKCSLCAVCSLPHTTRPDAGQPIPEHFQPPACNHP